MSCLKVGALDGKTYHIQKNPFWKGYYEDQKLIFSRMNKEDQRKILC